tara:strand:- start:555 stop:1379 length:825 start_codon:yes stop_codon:yes gene_type:complete
MNNLDKKTVYSFGKEWEKFTYSNVDSDIVKIFENYFKIFPKKTLNKSSIGFDMGCGTGRWAKFIAPNIKKLYCIDPSIDALNIAKKNLSKLDNCIFLNQDCNSFNIKNDTMDFGYSIGVLHHVPDTKKGLINCVKKLKKGSPFLLYLYYNLDNRGFLYKFIWYISNYFRIFISVLPFKLKLILTNLIAYLIYMPWIKFLKILNYFNFKTKNLPLSFYIDKNSYIIKTDSLDRFGTRLEKRFSKKEIETLMLKSGLSNISFHNESPYWIALGFKK